MSDNRKVAGTGLLLAASTAGCRLLSFGKELVVAALFGAGVVTDAYALLTLIPAFGMALFVQAARRSFLTQYAHREVEGPEAADAFTGAFVANVIGVAVVVAAVTSVVLRAVWWQLFSGAGPDVLETSYRLIVPAAWLMVPIAAIGSLTAILNAKGQFSRPQLTAVIPTLAILAAVAVGGRDWGAAGLIGGLLVGSVLQAFVLAAMAVRAGYRPRWEWPLRSAAARALWGVAMPLACLDLVSHANVLVDRAMASVLPTGSVAILTWSALLKNFLTGTLVASMLAVLLPFFSGQVARRDTEALRRSCGLVIRYAALALLPLSALLSVCGPPLLGYFRLGQLAPDDLRRIAWCLAAYGIGLFAEMASTSLYQALMALGRLRVLLLLALFANFIPNVVFNLLLIGPLGEVGLALSTSLVAFLTLAANYVVLRRAIGPFDGRTSLRVVAGALAATAVATAAGTATLWGVRRLRSEPSIELVAALLAGAVIVATYTFLVLVWPGSDDARLAARIVRDKLRSMLGRNSQ